MTETILFQDEFNIITAERLNALTPKESKVIRMKLGLLGDAKHTYKAIGLHFNVGPNRARQIAMKAFRKMRHPRFNKPEEIPLLEKDISSIMINKRLLNCLLSEGINCLNDIKSKRFESTGALEIFLLKIPNFGRKSWREFTEFLKQNNLSYNDFVLNKEEVVKVKEEEKISAMQQDINELKNITNHHYSWLKKFENYIAKSENNINQRCEIEVEAFKNEMHSLASEIQRNINSKILAFNEYMAVERYRLDQLLSNIKLTG